MPSVTTHECSATGRVEPYKYRGHPRVRAATQTKSTCTAQLFSLRTCLLYKIRGKEHSHFCLNLSFSLCGRKTFIPYQIHCTHRKQKYQINLFLRSSRLLDSLLNLCWKIIKGKAIFAVKVLAQKPSYNYTWRALPTHVWIVNTSAWAFPHLEIGSWSILSHLWGWGISILLYIFRNQVLRKQTTKTLASIYQSERLAKKTNLTKKRYVMRLILQALLRKTND